MTLCRIARYFRNALGAAAAATLMLAAPMTTHAVLIAGTANDTTGGFGVGFSFDPDVNLVIAQQFAVTAPIIADSVTVYLNDDNATNGADPFTLYITNAIGPAATAANVLATLGGTFPLTGGAGHAAVTFSSLALPLLPAPLAPDGYFLVIASPGGPDTGWGTGGTPIPSALGTIGNSYVGIVFGGGVGDYTTLDPGSPNSSITAFRVDAVAAIPEPSTYALMLAGLGLVGWIARKRSVGARV
jgi:hypothetical protein